MPRSEISSTYLAAETSWQVHEQARARGRGSKTHVGLYTNNSRGFWFETRQGREEAEKSALLRNRLVTSSFVYDGAR